MYKRIVILLFLVLMPVSQVLAKQDYTYIQSSLAFPWFMFFVFFALIMIPFFMVIAIAWRISGTGTSAITDVTKQPSQTHSSMPIKIWQKGRFNRFVLPVILIFVGIYSVLLVLNAYEAMDLMEHNGTAAPTMLNPRP